MPEIDLLARPEIKTAMSQRVKAKQLEEQAIELKEKADNVLIPVMITHQLKTIEHPLFGKFDYIPPGTTSKFDKDVMIGLLAANRVTPEVISRCIQGATKTKPREEYIKFAPLKVIK